MTLDEKLLAETRKAATEAAAAQDRADLAKARYHQAVAVLHRAGGSMREIAEALTISHQRVHQIVEQQTRKINRCSFCDKGSGEYRMLVALPDALICDECVGTAQVSVPGACSFCGETTTVYARREARICRTCLDNCAAFISEATSPQ